MTIRRIPGMQWCRRHDDGKGSFLPDDCFRDSSRPGYCLDCARIYQRISKSRIGNYRDHRFRALKRGLEPLSREEYDLMITRPCVYGGGIRPEILVGIDRISNELGYPDNSQPCCFFHNSVKNRYFSHAEMIWIIERFPRLKHCGNKTFRVPRQIPIVIERDIALPLFDSLFITS